MKVLMINGGPHPEGCTCTALKEVATTLGKEGIDSEIVWIGNSPDFVTEISERYRFGFVGTREMCFFFENGSQ